MRAGDLPTIRLTRLTRSREDKHPLIARLWAQLARFVGSDEQRRELLAGLQGRVLELGAGEDRNFGLYPATVREVVAVEPGSYLCQPACGSHGPGTKCLSQSLTAARRSCPSPRAVVTPP